MAAETILILGESGCGKSTSFRNLDPKETFIISTTSKPLPWRGWKKQYTKFNPTDNPDGNWYQTPKSSQITKIIKYVNAKRPEIRNIIIDDIQYAMSFEYMDRRSETGFQKFSDIGGDFTDMGEVHYLWQGEDGTSILLMAHHYELEDWVKTSKHAKPTYTEHLDVTIRVML